LRLTDIEVTTLKGQTLFSGIWEQGTDGYYLWINANQSSFISKWQELAAQNLRLVRSSSTTACGRACGGPAATATTCGSTLTKRTSWRSGRS